MSLPTTFDVVNVAHQLEDFYLSTAEIVEN